MDIIMWLLILAAISAGIELAILTKIENKELLYTLAFTVGLIMAVAIFFIFKING